MTRTQFAHEALKFVGYPSVGYTGPQSGQDEKGFNCSGFVCHTLCRIGFEWDKDIRHANEFFDHFGIFIHPESASTGDLVFWSRDGFRPTHIGILISTREYIHAPGRNKTVVNISALQASTIRVPKHYYYEQIYFRNPIGFKRLAIQSGRYQKTLPLK
ncbi:MAG: NlpC/P60 family [Candidatus Parcubacteria bacterium]|jgi:cell wall-associated NlpC family hydrolase